jgi:uncharacterized protein YceK
MKRIVAPLAVLIVLLSGCIKITSIDQPEKAKANSQIDIKVHMVTDLGEGGSAENLTIENAQGLLAIMVPSDWTLVSAELSGDVESKMIEDSSLVQDNWETGPGYRWLVLKTEEGFTYTEQMAKFTASIRLQVGGQTGMFKLVYHSGAEYESEGQVTSAWHDHTETTYLTVQ